MKEALTILMVDDDADDRELFVDAVKEVDNSFECITKNNGQQALEMLKTATGSLPDLIFLDLRMPGFSGKRFLFEIKSDEKLKQIPVIIYTTSKNVEESKELKEMGALHFISKPSNAEEIYYLVSIALEEHINYLRRAE